MKLKGRWKKASQDTWMYVAGSRVHAFVFGAGYPRTGFIAYTCHTEGNMHFEAVADAKRYCIERLKLLIENMEGLL